MPVFKDNNGREWTVKLDAPKIVAVREQCDLNLTDAEGKAYGQLHDDEVLLVNVLWVLCREQAQQANLTDVQFGEALVGDAIERATEAMLQAMLDFFRPSKRQLLQTLATKNRTLREAGMAKALERLNDPELEKKLLAAQEAEIEAVLQKTLTRLNSATSSLASAE